MLAALLGTAQAAASLDAMLMQTVLSHSTLRATHRNPGGQGRARVYMHSRKDFSCFSGFGAERAHPSLSPPPSGANPNPNNL
jgi:hypothetical protein